MVGQLEHSTGFALRSAADKADIFVFAAVLFVLWLFFGGIFFCSIRHLCVSIIFFVILSFTHIGLCFFLLRDHFSIIIIIIICHVILLFVSYHYSAVYLGNTSCSLDIRTSPYHPRLQSIFAVYLGNTSCSLDIRASPYHPRPLRNNACKQSYCIIPVSDTSHCLRLLYSMK